MCPLKFKTGYTAIVINTVVLADRETHISIERKREPIERPAPYSR